MHVENLRSPFVQCGRIFYFPRMIDKIRLHAAGQLPHDYQANLGGGFDARLLSFLWIEYAPLVERVKEGGTDEEILEWAFNQGRKPSDEEIEIWNDFMRKRGWNDESSNRIAQRKRESGISDRDDIQTFFAYIDIDEAK
ncbi:MAG: DUF5069 domain-containing protein [Chthoniobacteraceae bacterium]